MNTVQTTTTKRRVRARELMHWPVDEVFEWAQPNDRVYIEMDDGVHELRARRIFFSYMHWSLHRMYPETPLTKENLVDKRKFTAGSSVALQSAAYRQCMYAYPQENREVLWKALFDMFNHVYNFFTYALEEYVTTICADDFYQITVHPEVKKIIAEAEPTREGIESAYKKLTKVLSTDKTLHANPIARAVRTEHVSIGQVLQCIGMRGFLTDINSEIFRDPVMRSYAAGLISLPDSLKESRSAAKSLLFNKEQIKKSEYFGRELQIATAVVQRLHPGDCGSRETIPMPIRDETDLKGFHGRFIVREDGSLLSIQPHMKELIGTTVNMRSVCYCHHSDPAGVCATCYGELSHNFALTDNVGDCAARTGSQQVTQNILGTKHHDGSSTVSTSPIPPEYQHILRYSQNMNDIKLARELKGKHVLIKMKLGLANMLYDVAEAEEISSLIPQRLFNMTLCDMEIYDRKDESYRKLKVNFDFCGRPVVPSKAFIRYLKRHSWEVTADGIVIFDLKHWDNSRTLFQMPLIHKNMMEYAKEIEREFKFGKGSFSAGFLSEDEATPEEVANVLYYWHRLCAQRLRMNLSHLDVILYASMIRSPHTKDYRMPKQGTTRYFSTFKKNMNMRSLSMKFAHQEQLDAFQNPNSYIPTMKPDHPIDYMLLPRKEPKPEDVITL